MWKLLDSDKLNKFEREFHWLARIFTIIYIVFICIFPPETSFSSAGTWGCIIPGAVILIALIISWNHEIAGVGIFTALALFSIWFFNAAKDVTLLFTITFPLFLIAILLLIDFHAKKKHLKEMKEFKKAAKKNAKLAKEFNNKQH